MFRAMLEELRRDLLAVLSLLFVKAVDGGNAKNEKLIYQKLSNTIISKLIFPAGTLGFYCGFSGPAFSVIWGIFNLETLPCTLAVARLKPQTAKTEQP